MEDLAELGEGVGVMCVEEGVEAHVVHQRQGVGLEGARQEIEVSQKRFAGVEPRAGVVTGGIVQNIEQGLLAGLAGQPGMGTGVILPEGTQVVGLPAFDGFGDGFVAGVLGEVVFEGPAADPGAVGLEVQPTMEFTSASAVGRDSTAREKPRFVPLNLIACGWIRLRGGV